MGGHELKLNNGQEPGLLVSFFVLISIMLLTGCVSSSGNPASRDSKEIEAERLEKAVVTHVQLAVSYLKRGQLEIALEKINTALEFDPKSSDAHTVAGAINERIGRYDKAEHHYARAVKLQPDDGSALNNYGQFLCKIDKADRAEGYFNHAVEDPFYETPAAAMGNACSCFVKAGQMERAEPYCRQAIEQDARIPDPYYHLARVFYQQEQYMKARAFLQRYDSVGQNTPESLMLCVKIENRLGAEDLASSCRDRLLRGFSKSEQAKELQKEATR